MTAIEGVFFWGAMFAYLFSFASYLRGWLFAGGRSSSYGWYFLLAATALNTMAIGWRWITIGHPPVQGPFELGQFAVWTLAVVFIIAGWLRPELRGLGSLVSPSIIIIMGLSLIPGVALEPLQPPYKSNWLWIHVSFAWLAFGGFFIATALAIVYLLRESSFNRAGLGAFLERFPDPATTDDLIAQYVAFGFISEALMIVSGGIWATTLWGRFWGWDPVETWSLIVWLTYGLFLHLRLTRGWRGRRAAWLAIFAIITVIISNWGVKYLPSVHVPIL